MVHEEHEYMRDSVEGKLSRLITVLPMNSPASHCLQAGGICCFEARESF